MAVLGWLPGHRREPREPFLLCLDPTTGNYTQLDPGISYFGVQPTTLEPRVVQVAPDRWAMLYLSSAHPLFSSQYVTEYRLITDSCNIVARHSFAGMWYSSSSAPISLGDRIYWAGTLPEGLGTNYIYGMDLSDPYHPVLLD